MRDLIIPFVHVIATVVARRPAKRCARRDRTIGSAKHHVQNVLNHRNFNNPSGVITSPFFGQSTSAQVPRTIELGVRLNF